IMTISINATPSLLTEESATQLIITLTSSEPIPNEGLLVSLDSDVANALGQFNLLTTQFDNLQLVSVNDDISGFTVLLNAQTGTITTPVLDDRDPDSPQNITFIVEPSEEYSVDENAGAVTITIEDADGVTVPIPTPQTPSLEPVFGSVEPNVIEVQGSNQLIFAGEGDDLIDLSFNLSPTATFPVEEVTITELNQAFDEGTLTSEELVEQYIERIEAFDQQGVAINSIITLNPDALATAIALDEERQTSGTRSPLHGIPILIKDNIDTFDLPTSAGSVIFENSIPPDDAFVVEQLRDAGAIILGKTNLDEFARGVRGLSLLGGQTLNPYALDRVPGGSSAGTAAAIASNFSTLGLGTETGVSIRNPAANNNLVGIVPTEGLVSRDGVVPLSFTQDRVGTLSRTVTDGAIALDIIAGFDENNPVTEASLDNIPEDGYTSFLSTTALSGKRIGVFGDLFRSGEIHEESLAIIDDAINDLEAEGAIIIDDVSLGFDLFDFLDDARVSSFEFKFALNDYLASLGDDAPVETLEDIIEDGRYIPSLGNSLIFSESVESLEDNEDYLERLSRREFLRNATIEIMEELDLDAIVYPMKTVTAPLIGETLPEADNSFTSIAGLPGIVVPAGFTDEGLPVGLEFSGLPYSEAELLGLAYDYEQATLHRTPPDSLLNNSNGDNRIYGGSGNDRLILGQSDRLFGGAGDDSFFATSGGDNIITGGAGADSFWIASAEIPESANVITDFTRSEDVIGLAGLGIGFEDVSITNSGGDALIVVNDSDLAILRGVAASSLTESDFIFG
ncbi:MAG: amidase family protein, partial [Cyanobacteria bacterium P01_G01_bin.49]